MKKIIGMVLALFLIVNLALPARAVPQKYVIAEAGISFAMPSGYDIFYREMQEDDPLFTKYNTDKESLMIIFENGVFLSALNSAGEEEIVVTVEQCTELDELNGLGETTLMILASAIKGKYEENDISVSAYDIYHHPQLDFIRIFYQATDESVYGVQYYTIYNSIILNFFVYSYDGPVSSFQNDAIASVVDSIQLQSHTPKITPTEPQEATPAFPYTDEETGTTFTVPAGWTELGVTEEENFHYVQFSYTRNPAQILQYCSIDMYKDLDFSERLFINRAEYEKAFCDGFLGQMSDTESPVEEITYNGVSYFIGESSVTSDEHGVPITVTVTQALHKENGWIYTFQFLGGMDDQYFEEFEKVLESVKYGNNAARSSDMTITVIISVVLLAALVLLILGIKTAQKTTKESDPESERSEYVYCQSCGKRFPAGSRFCDVCGERLTKKEREL